MSTVIEVSPRDVQSPPKPDTKLTGKRSYHDLKQQVSETLIDDSKFVIIPPRKKHKS